MKSSFLNWVVFSGEPHFFIGDTMENKKLIWVADSLHSSIPISALEKMVISTQVFNRLHNILQNSTVYLTYPSNRTSRFSHSLGCLHLAGELYRYSILNALPEHRSKFFNDLETVINRIQRGDPFSQTIDRFNSESSNHTQTKQMIITDEINDPVYKSVTPDFLTDANSRNFEIAQKERFLFTIGFQAVRFTALLHDLGHPPFSHVTEYALQSLLGEYSNKIVNNLTIRQREFKKITSDFFDQKGFHEKLGCKLAEHIFKELVDVIKKINYSYKSIYDICRIIHLTLEIFTSKESILEALHKIIDSDLDADRLDYVLRDLRASGINQEVLNYDRLITSFQLVYDDNNCPRFVPSVRSLSTLEEFFRRRFNLYKYVIYHHRVAKTDGLLKEVLIEISKEYLETKGEKETTDSLLPCEIQGLWEVLEFDGIKEHLIDNYIQWDDAWLLTMLRHHYFRLKKENKTTDMLNKSILKIRLEELLSNKKTYHSLFKRIDSFITIDEAFIKSIPDDFKWDQIKMKLGLPSKLNIYKEFTDYYREIRPSKGKNDDSLCVTSRELKGLFLNLFFEILDSGSRAGARTSLINNAIPEFKENFEIEDVIIIPKNINPGVSNQMYLVMENKTKYLGEVSRLADELKRASRLFPPFFLFFHTKKSINETELLKMREFLGKQMWSSFNAWMNLNDSIGYQDNQLVPPGKKSKGRRKE